MIKDIKDYLHKNVLISKMGENKPKEVFISDISTNNKYFKVYNDWFYCGDYEIVGIVMPKKEEEYYDYGITFDYC